MVALFQLFKEQRLLRMYHTLCLQYTLHYPHKVRLLVSNYLRINIDYFFYYFPKRFKPTDLYNGNNDVSCEVGIDSLYIF
jgi:hypothetical protein